MSPTRGMILPLLVLPLLAGLLTVLLGVADAQRRARFTVTVHAIFSGGQSSRFTPASRSR